ncbi:MAG: hypothetical protein IPI49_20855 [Myxococcales bacterium]|nr:hypothetical protein [Myxococcales bacterium]
MVVRSPVWRRRGLAALAASALGVAGLAGWRTRAVEAPPAVVVGGSGTVLYGFLAPVRPLIEKRGALSIPISSTFDLGSGGALRSLVSGELDIAAFSTRFDRAVPSEVRNAGKLMVEVPIGFDETALFVRADHPMRRIDVRAVRAHLCCGRGQDRAPATWADLGATAQPLAERPVLWTAFGRTDPPTSRDSSSATLLQADVWFCDTLQFCASPRAGGVSADEVLAKLMTEVEVLALSSRSFSTSRDVALVTVDGRTQTRLDGRKILWLYLALPVTTPLPSRLCRFLNAVLDAAVVRRLAQLGKAQGLPELPRRWQRAALGLDDGSCSSRPLAERATPQELEAGILRSPVANAIEIKNRWVPDPGP